jgi:hypothetical protein
VARIVFTGGGVVQVPGSPEQVAEEIRAANSEATDFVSFSNGTIMVAPGLIAFICIDEDERSPVGEGIKGA